jgi:hypothetical protein
MNHFYAATYIPWTIRPVYAFLSDHVPLRRRRRLPYFLLCALAGGAVQVCLACFGTASASFVGFAVLLQMCIAFMEVCCDSLGVERGNQLAELLPLTLPTPTHSAAAAATEEEEEEHKEDNEAQPLPVDATSGWHQQGSDNDSNTAAPAAAATEEDDLSDSSSARRAADRAALCAFFTETARGNAALVTPLAVQSRVQSECMTSRLLGSMLAASINIVLLLFLNPRTIILFASTLFPFCCLALMQYAHEKKVQSGRLFLASVGETVTEAPFQPVSSADDGDAKHSSSSGFVPELELAQGVGYASTGSSTRTSPLRSQVPRKQSLHVSAADTTDASSASNSSGGRRRSSEDASGPSSSSVPPLSQSLLDSSSTGLRGPSSWATNNNEDDGRSISLWHYLRGRVLQLWSALLLVVRPLLFIFLLNAVPGSSDSFYTYLYSDYGSLLNWQFGTFTLVGLTGSLLGGLFYQRVVAPHPRFNLRRVFVWTTLAGAAASCLALFVATKTNYTLLRLNDMTFLTLESLLNSAIGILAVLPSLVLAAAYAPKRCGLEASMFSLFAAAAHVGSLLSAVLSAALTNALGIRRGHWGDLWIFMLLCTAASILPLLTMPWLLPTQQPTLVKEPADATAAADAGEGAQAASVPVASPAPAGVGGP